MLKKVTTMGLEVLLLCMSELCRGLEGSVLSVGGPVCCKECFRKGLPNRLGIGSTDSC
jgi:hypothetical protein